MGAAERPVVGDLSAGDAAAAAALVDEAALDEKWRARLGDWIREASDEKGERCGTVARIDDTVAGFAIHGAVAGTEATGALHAVLVGRQFRGRGVGSALLGACRHAMGDPRVIVAELPVEAPAAALEMFLRARGFEEAGRVEDYFADGIALVILTSRRAPVGGAA